MENTISFSDVNTGDKFKFAGMIFVKINQHQGQNLSYPNHYQCGGTQVFTSLEVYNIGEP